HPFRLRPFLICSQSCLWIGVLASKHWSQISGNWDVCEVRLRRIVFGGGVLQLLVIGGKSFPEIIVVQTLVVVSDKIRTVFFVSIVTCLSDDSQSTILP